MACFVSGLLYNLVYMDSHSKKLTFVDLFAGAGGLSEGFIRAGFTPAAHVEYNEAACYTLKTRMAYHWLKEHGRISSYRKYLHGEITRKELYDLVPRAQIDSVINSEIGSESLPEIFWRIDQLIGKKKLDLIIGGPPCQAYSLVGRSRDKNKMKGDKRNFLYLYYTEFLKRYKPKYFVFENVLGLLSAKSPEGILYLDSMREEFNKAGYATEYEVLHANEYGVPQGRKRIILVGRRGRRKGFYPEIETWLPNIKVQEVLSDLPVIRAGGGKIGPCNMKEYSGKYLYESGVRNDKLPVTMHIARPHTKQDLEIYSIAQKKWNKSQERLNYNDLPGRLKTHKNCSSFTDRFKVVAGDMSYSHTVVAHISKDGHYYIHPKQKRSLTPREAARLQTFPDDFFFESVSEKTGRTAAYHQIGNAVPVLLAEKIAEKLMKNF